jgi:hypothetical protein
MIDELGFYQCDFCGNDSGNFNRKTGNHPICEENQKLKSLIRELVEVNTEFYKVYINRDEYDINNESDLEKKHAALMDKVKEVMG